MAVSPLSPSDVQTATGVAASADDIEVAEALIVQQTGFELQEHVDTRDIAETLVRRAWAIVASRICNSSVLTAGIVAGEADGDYTYSLWRSGPMLEQMAAQANDPVLGQPWLLLHMGLATAEHVSWQRHAPPL